MPYTFIFKAQLPAKIHRVLLTSNLQLKSKKIPLIHSFRANDVAVYYSCINLCNLGSMQIPPSSSTLKHSNIVSNALMHFPVFLVTLLNCISIFCVVLMPHDHHIVTEQYRQISV